MIQTNHASFATQKVPPYCSRPHPVLSNVGDSCSFKHDVESQTSRSALISRRCTAKRNPRAIIGTHQNAHTTNPNVDANAGKLCDEHEYYYEWKEEQSPIFTKKEAKLIIDCKSENVAPTVVLGVIVDTSPRSDANAAADSFRRPRASYSRLASAIHGRTGRRSISGIWHCR